jgi:hypothetical protein
MEQLKTEYNFETGQVTTTPLREEEIAYLNSIPKPTYAELRAAEYPDFREYLDGVVKNDQTQIQAYIDACLAVKAKYPKPAE